MNDSRKKTRFMVLVTMLCSIQLILMLTPLGFIDITPLGLRITTMHVPVILAGILLGVKAGSILGLVFGISSVVTNTLRPGIISFVFTPFYSLGDHSGNIWSLVIAIVPRVLLGVLSALIYKFFKDKKYKISGSLITSVVCTLLHSIMVLGLIFLFFGPDFAQAQNIEGSALFTFIVGIIFTNGLVEALLAAFIVTALVKALEPMVKKVS